MQSYKVHPMFSFRARRPRLLINSSDTHLPWWFFLSASHLMTFSNSIYLVNRKYKNIPDGKTWLNSLALPKIGVDKRPDFMQTLLMLDEIIRVLQLFVHKRSHFVIISVFVRLIKHASSVCKFAKGTNMLSQLFYTLGLDNFRSKREKWIWHYSSLYLFLHVQ